MTAQDILDRLQALSDPRATRSWQRHGLSADRLLGVGLARLRAFAREEFEGRRDSALADALWQTGIHEARLLAAHLYDPARVTREQLDRQAAELDFWDLADEYGRLVAAPSPAGWEWANDGWSDEREFVRRAAAATFAEIATNRVGDCPDDLEPWEDMIRDIEQTIHAEPNWAREGKLLLLIAIGKSDEDLRAEALLAARRIGPIEVSYGESGCAPPDAVAQLSRRPVV